MNQKYDYVIVGTGFASSFFLKKILEKTKKKINVLVLEKGYMYPHKKRLDDKRKQILGLPKDFSKEINAEASYELGKESWVKPWVFQLSFGGGSNCWHACTPRMIPNDFQVKTKYGIADDWPITYDELEPFYEEAESIMSISGPDEVPWPKKNSYPQPPHQFNTVDAVLKKEYGELYFQQPTARARTTSGSRGVCCSNNICYLCPSDAKFTIENGLEYLYKESSVKLVYGASVTNVELVNNIAKGVYYIDSNNKSLFVEADTVVLGANPIFNSSILLSSGDTMQWLGKGISEQGSISANVFLEGFKNVGASTKISALGHMLYDGEHRKSIAACSIESNNALESRIHRRGSNMKEHIENWRNIASFRIIFEDIPERRNFISISDSGKPIVNYFGRSEYFENSISHVKKRFEELYSVLPIKEIDFTGMNPTESHILGGHRMSQKPEDGVTDKSSLHHKYRNLFVLGGGGFVTCSPANPSLTISALSLYAADKI